MVAPLIGALAVQGLTAAMGKLTDALVNSLAKMDKFQATTLAYGKSLDGVTNQVTDSFSQLHGTLDQRVTATLESVRVGLTGNSKEMTKLINVQQLTGQNFKNTAQLMSDLRLGLDFTTEEIDGLSTSLLETSDKYNITTDKLIETLASLNKSYSKFDILGFDSSLVGAIEELQGIVGAGASKDLTAFISMMADPNKIALRQKLGLSEVMASLRATKDQTKQVEILKAAIMTAKDRIFDLTDSTGNYDAALIRMAALFENTEGTFNRLGNALEDMRKDTEETIQGQYHKQFNVLMNNFVALFQLFVTKNYPLLMDIFSDLAEKGLPLFAQVLGDLATFIGTKMIPALDEALDLVPLSSHKSQRKIAKEIIDSDPSIAKPKYQLGPGWGQHGHGQWVNLGTYNAAIKNKIGELYGFDRFEEFSTSMTTWGTRIKQVMGSDEDRKKILEQMEGQLAEINGTAKDMRDMAQEEKDSEASPAKHLQSTVSLLHDNLQFILGIQDSNTQMLEELQNQTEIQQTTAAATVTTAVATEESSNLYGVLPQGVGLPFGHPRGPNQGAVQDSDL
jgi:hypothetical protein